MAPGETFADVKKRTACSVCGRIGHWRGDPSCPESLAKVVCICGSGLEESGFLLIDDAAETNAEPGCDDHADEEEYQDVVGADHDAYVASRLTSEGPASLGTFFCFPGKTEVSDKSDKILLSVMFI